MSKWPAICICCRRGCFRECVVVPRKSAVARCPEAGIGCIPGTRRCRTADALRPSSALVVRGPVRRVDRSRGRRRCSSQEECDACGNAGTSETLVLAHRQGEPVAGDVAGIPAHGRRRSGSRGCDSTGAYACFDSGNARAGSTRACDGRGRRRGAGRGRPARAWRPTPPGRTGSSNGRGANGRRRQRESAVDDGLPAAGLDSRAAHIHSTSSAAWQPADHYR
jgi:hypothetical protein